MVDKKAFEELNRALRLTNEVNDLILRASEEKLLLNEICRLIVDIGGYRLAWVGLKRHDEEKSVPPTAIYGIAKEYADNIKVSWDAENPFGQGPTGRAIRSGHTVTTHVSDEKYAPWRDNARKHGFSASAALPMHLDNEVVGALNIYSANEGAFGDDELILLERMADNLACGLRNIKASAELKKLSDAFKHLNQPLFITDVMGKIEYVNKAFVELTGYAEGEAIGQTPAILKSESHPPEFYKAIRDTLLKGKGWKGKIVNRMKNGQPREEFLAITPLKGEDGKIVSFVCIITDIA